MTNDLIDEKPKRLPCKQDEHDYKEVYGDMECESYECTKCGDRYKLWYDEMR